MPYQVRKSFGQTGGSLGPIRENLLRSMLLGVFLPAAAAVSLSVALGGRDVSGLGLTLIASGTIAAYGLDRLIDRRDWDSRLLRGGFLFCVLVSALVAGVLACTTWRRFQVCSFLGLVAGAYVPLKQYIPKNLLTTGAWTIATATLPFAIQPPLNPLFVGSVLSVAFMVLANTILCDIPDFEADRQSGVRGITPRFGPRAGAISAIVCSCLGTIIAAFVGCWVLALTSLAMGVLAVIAFKDSEQYNFRLLADLVVTILPGPLTLLFQ